ncbi:hypothetical protein BHE74_00056984 [Ensete ventricosum]|nr:hypothetical protein BHE74_00056984 [Ensete ventricosum]
MDDHYVHFLPACHFYTGDSLPGSSAAEHWMDVNFDHPCKRYFFNHKGRGWRDKHKRRMEEQVGRVGKPFMDHFYKHPDVILQKARAKN